MIAAKLLLAPAAAVSAGTGAGQPASQAVSKVGAQRLFQLQLLRRCTWPLTSQRPDRNFR